MYAEWHNEREENAQRVEEEREEARVIELLEGMIKREELKKSLFEFLYSQ